MATYIILYESVGPRDASEQIHEAAKKYAHWGRITDSSWAVDTEKTAVEIRDEIKTHIHTGDRLFVVRSGTEAAWSSVRASNEWLKKYL